MQDDSKATPQKNMSAKGKYIYQNLIRSPQNKTPAKKNLLLISYT